MKLGVTLAAGVLTAGVLFAQQADIGPPPGRLVDVGERRLHLHCTGSGSPTVVIEDGPQTRVTSSTFRKEPDGSRFSPSAFEPPPV